MAVKRPAIVRQNNKRVSSSEIKVGDIVFIDISGRASSIHCKVERVETKQRKRYVYFSEMGTNPNRFSGHNRQRRVLSIDWYPFN